MFYDLDVPYSVDDHQLPRTLAFLHELGYNVVALNHVVGGKLPGKLVCAIPDPLPPIQARGVPSSLTVLRRVTLVLTDNQSNVRSAELGRAYDLLALEPTDETTLQQACSTIDCDIVTMDLSVRLSFSFGYKMLNDAVRAGKKIEITYAAGILGSTPEARRNLISNATQIIRACRGRGVIISSGAKDVLAARGPSDVVNLSTMWGLAQDRAHEAVTREARNVVVNAKLKRTSYRGVVDVVYGGEKPVLQNKEGAKQTGGHDNKHDYMQKRKIDDNSAAAVVDKPLSKTQMKKRAKLEAARKTDAEKLG